MMDYRNHVLRMVGKELESIESRKTGLATLSVLVDRLAEVVNAFSSVNNAFETVGWNSIWIECPECKSPTLIEMGKCRVCGTDLLEEDVPNSISKDSLEKESHLIEKEEEAKNLITEIPYKKRKGGPKKEKVATDTDAPKRGRGRPKKVETKEVEYVPIIEDSSADWEVDGEITAPSVEEVNKMKIPELKETIEEFDLPVVFVSGGSVKELRVLVNAALEALTNDSDDDYVEDEDEKTDILSAEEKMVEVTSDDEDDIELEDSDFDFSELEEELDSMIDDE